MIILPIFIGSDSDKYFLSKGLEYLKKQGIVYKVIVSSTHRNPQETSSIITKTIKEKDIKVVIAGAATATGLPGIVAGYLKETDIAIFGVRFIKKPGPNIIEDASFNLSAMPEHVPLAYTGFNEKGFYHACILAARIIKSSD